MIENVGNYKSKARVVMKASDGKERLKAAELLGKLHGIFSEKIKVDIPIPVVIYGDLED